MDRLLFMPLFCDGQIHEMRFTKGDGNKIRLQMNKYNARLDS